VPQKWIIFKNSDEQPVTFEMKSNPHPPTPRTSGVAKKVNNLMSQSELDAKYLADAKYGKICNRRQARENVQTLLSAGKHANVAKRAKTCNLCQTR